MFYFVEFRIKDADGHLVRTDGHIVEAESRAGAGRAAHRLIAQTRTASRSEQVSFDRSALRPMRTPDVPAWKVRLHKVGEREGERIETVVACSRHEALRKACRKASELGRRGLGFAVTPHDVSFAGRLYAIS